MSNHSVADFRSMRAIVPLLLLCLLVGCDGAKYRQSQHRENLDATEEDYFSLAQASFKLIDPKGAITTIVVPAELDPRARAALKKIAKLVSPSQIPSSQDYLLPAGYFSLQTFSIEDGQSNIEGQLGPVTPSITAAGLPDCGKNYTVVFFLEGLDWVSHSYKITTCTESRHWVPVDAAAPSQ